MPEHTSSDRLRRLALRARVIFIRSRRDSGAHHTYSQSHSYHHHATASNKALIKSPYNARRKGVIRMKRNHVKQHNGLREVFCKFVYRNGKRIYPKGKCFHFWVKV